MPVKLPPPLASYLRDQTYAMLAQDTTDGAVLIVKMPSADIEDCRGRLPIYVVYQVHKTEYGPLARLVLVVYMKVRMPFEDIEEQTSIVMETFFNPADPQQLADLKDLTSRDQLRVLFYNDDLEHVLSKRVTQSHREELDSLADTVLRLFLEMSLNMFDFDKAKAIVIAENPIGVSDGAADL